MNTCRQAVGKFCVKSSNFSVLNKGEKLDMTETAVNRNYQDDLIIKGKKKKKAEASRV